MMKRRDFIGLLGGTVTWPLATRAQGGMPVVGYLSSFSPGDKPQAYRGIPRGP